MAFTYDLNTDRGKVRLLIPDNNVDSYVFEDDEIDKFLALENIDGENNVKLASALALETLASSEVLIQKKIKLLDLTTDGVSISKELRARAERLREESDQESSLEIAEMNLNDFNFRQLIINNAL